METTIPSAKIVTLSIHVFAPSVLLRQNDDQGKTPNTVRQHGVQFSLTDNFDHDVVFFKYLEAFYIFRVFGDCFSASFHRKF